MNGESAVLGKDDGWDARIRESADAVEWVTEHPDIPIDPTLRAFAEIVKERAGRLDAAQAGAAASSGI